MAITHPNAPGHGACPPTFGQYASQVRNATMELDGEKVDRTQTIAASGDGNVLRIDGGTAPVQLGSGNHVLAVTRADAGDVDAGESLTLVVTPYAMRGYTGVVGPLKANQYDFEVAVIDENDGRLLHGVADGVWYRPYDPIDRDLANQVRAGRGRDEFILSTTWLGDAAHLIFLAYGQSNSECPESWPKKTTVPVAGNYMPGADVRGESAEVETFVPLGADVLTPLVAVTRNGDTILSSGDEAALTPGALRNSETIEITALNTLRWMLNAERGRDTAFEKTFILANTARGGRTIGELSKGPTEGSVEYYSRFVDSVSVTAAIAAATPLPTGLLGWDPTAGAPVSEGPTSAVAAVHYVGNESDYLKVGDNSTRILYKAALAQLIDDLRADIPAQARRPPWFATVPGGPYTRNTDINGERDLFVSMAMQELMRERSDFTVAQPIYPVTDKHNHLDVNGVRWLGCKLGQAMHRVLVQRRRWLPLSLIGSEVVGDRAIFLHFDVPHGPLRFQAVYRQASSGSATDLQTYWARNYGFQVLDSVGGAPLDGLPEIVAPTVIKLTTRRPIDAASSSIYYAWGEDTNIGGKGNVCDSDPFVAPYNYVYDAGSGQYAAANIPALVDKPYPMNNFLLPFYVPATWEAS